MTLHPKINDFLFRRIAPDTLGVFRAFTGLLLFIQIGRIKEYILEVLPEAQFRLTYDFFHWVTLAPVPQLETIFTLMTVAAVCITLGLFFRVASAVYFLTWTYILLTCNGHYNNHYYLVSLLSLLFIFTNADKSFSLRPYLDKFLLGLSFLKNTFIQKSIEKSQKDRTLPYWQLFLFQAQIFIVYFYGGLAKFNADWLNGYPLKIWLPGKDIPFGLSAFDPDTVAMFFSYGGLIFDLVIGFLLFHKKLRYVAIPALLFFHVSNHFLWTIGIFPWFMIGATVLFLPEDAPGKALAWIQSKISNPKTIRKPKNQKKTAPEPVAQPQPNKAVLAFVTLYLAFQLLFPLRHYLYPGNPAWHGQGSEFSWRMMLIDKTAAAKFAVYVPDKGKIGEIDILKYVSPRQFKAMAYNPRFYINFAHTLRDTMKAHGLAGEPDIRAYVWRQVNGRPYQLYLDTTVNLASYEYSPFKIPDVLMPFENLEYKEDHVVLTAEERKNFGY